MGTRRLSKRKNKNKGLVNFGELSTDGMKFYSWWTSLGGKLAALRSRILVDDTNTEENREIRTKTLSLIDLFLSLY